MSYRPITDVWFLARARLKGGEKYYGAYLGGFPERARALLGCRIDEPVLHVCGGKARLYPYRRAVGPNDRTLDIDPRVQPDFIRDARDCFPACGQEILKRGGKWAGILIDPPYSREEASNYSAGPEKYPPPGLLLRNAFDALPPGGRVGIIHYLLPKPPAGAIFVAAVAVYCGFNNRVRSYSVFERPHPFDQAKKGPQPTRRGPAKPKRR